MIGPARMARGATRWLAPIAILMATLTDAMAGAALGVGRPYVMGAIHATPDEAAWLDIAYTSLKLVGFAIAPDLIARWRPRPALLVSVLIMGGACVLTGCFSGLEALVLLRAIQGLAGAVLLVSGQTFLFVEYPRASQPALQAVFAIGAVVAPTTLAPALAGWLIDTQSWTWVFWSIAPIALAAIGLFLLCDEPAGFPRPSPLTWDGWEFALTGVAMLSFTYVLSQGSRWNWLEAPRIVFLLLAGAAATVLLIARTGLGRPATLLDMSVLRSVNFAFALVVSFVAGAALLGSAFLIPALTLGVLRLTPTEAGGLLLPSGGAFAASLLLTAAAVQIRKLSPIATVPAGVLIFMGAMALLSTPNADSGPDTLALAILLRGFALGLLFLSITLIMLSDLTPDNVAQGVGLFNIGRQLGGLLGIAGLQTLIDHDTASNRAAVAANITSAMPAVGERLTLTGGQFLAAGVDGSRVNALAARQLAQSVEGQATLIAFGSAAFAIALLFVVAGPCVIVIRILLTRGARRSAD